MPIPLRYQTFTMPIGVDFSSEKMTEAKTRAKAFFRLLQLDCLCSDKGMKTKQPSGLPVDIEERQEHDELSEAAIERHSGPKQRTCKDLPSYIGERRCKYPTLYPDPCTGMDELKDPEDTDLYDDTEWSSTDETLCASLTDREPRANLLLTEGLRAQILANSSALLYLERGTKKVPELLTVKLDCGRYMAMVALEDKDDPDWPMARIVKSKKYFSLMPAYDDLLELVSEDLYTALQWKIR
ncbi:hypothetical protein MBLNU457_2255t1 [Dothideomycetes sp. NU457]